MMSDKTFWKAENDGRREQQKVASSSTSSLRILFLGREDFRGFGDSSKIENREITNYDLRFIIYHERFTTSTILDS
jgi:hypothetical protein